MLQINVSEQMVGLRKLYSYIHITSQKVVDSSPVEVIGFFDLPNPSVRIKALGLTQPQQK
jgi:hypothetical protein